MTILSKDLKILWSRSMGRCAICRKKVVIDASTSVPSNASLIGESCHIVAEKPDGPRGQSILSEEDRNRYPNLILLCRDDHKMIDDDPVAWPVERLHQLKADHEMWVEQLAPTDMDDAIAKLYGDLVNSLTDSLWLERWASLTDTAVCDALREEFIDGVRAVGIKVQRTIWPGKHGALEEAIKNVSARATAYVDAFMELAYRDDQGWFRQNKRWAQTWVADFDERVHQAEEWQKRCMTLLWNLTHALNEFATQVRATVTPTYFLHTGAFYILDSMGVTNQMEGVAYFPDDYK